MTHTKTLEDLEYSLANPSEMSEEEYADVVDELNYYYDKHGDYFTVEEFDIYNRADMLIGSGEEYYETTAAAKEDEYRSEAMRYLNSEGNH
jgi:hypothetical protein